MIEEWITEGWIDEQTGGCDYICGQMKEAVGAARGRDQWIRGWLDKVEDGQSLNGEVND